MDNLLHYLNFIKLALYGPRPDLCDSYFKEHAESILEGAAYFRNKFDYKPTKLYRGILVEPELVIQGRLPAASNITYLSFTEDSRVAAEFADKTSTMSSYLAMVRPRVWGYIIEHTPKPEEVLFHWSWYERIPLLCVGNLLDSDVIKHQKETVLHQQWYNFPLIPYARFAKRD